MTRVERAIAAALLFGGVVLSIVILVHFAGAASLPHRSFETLRRHDARVGIETLAFYAISWHR